MDFEQITFSNHAAVRMLERHIGKKEIIHILKEDKIIEEYPDDKPHPSKLVLGFSQDRPIHVVAAMNDEESEIIVITVYEPTDLQWSANFKARKKP